MVPTSLPHPYISLARATRARTSVFIRAHKQAHSNGLQKHRIPRARDRTATVDDDDDGDPRFARRDTQPRESERVPRRSAMERDGGRLVGGGDLRVCARGSSGARDRHHTTTCRAGGASHRRPRFTVQPRFVCWRKKSPPLRARPTMVGSVPRRRPRPGAGSAASRCARSA